MSRVYYDVRYLLDNVIRYLIWYSNDVDRVLTDEDRRLPVFRTRQSLAAYARGEGLTPLHEGESAFMNLDAVRNWLKRKRPGRVDCVALLNAWNLFADMSASVGGGFDSDKERTRKIYEKLFWGSNLPSLTPPGRYYVPLWSGQEVRIMRQVLGEGLSLFRSHVRTQPRISQTH